MRYPNHRYQDVNYKLIAKKPFRVNSGFGRIIVQLNYAIRRISSLRPMQTIVFLETFTGSRPTFRFTKIKYRWKGQSDNRIVTVQRVELTEEKRDQLLTLLIYLYSPLLAERKKIQRIKKGDDSIDLYRITPKGIITFNLPHRLFNHFGLQLSPRALSPVELRLTLHPFLAANYKHRKLSLPRLLFTRWGLLSLRDVNYWSERKIKSERRRKQKISKMRKNIYKKK